MTTSTNPTLDDPRYRASYRAMLEALCASKRDFEYRLCSFWPATGKHYGNGLRVLLLGRAVNGWVKDSDPFRDSVGPAVEAARIKASEGLDWVARQRGDETVYNTNRSQFWMTGGAMLCAMVEGLDLAGEDWIQRLAWTNLARVAPYEGGNPDTTLWNPQEGPGRELLELELELLDPQVVIAFTGWEGWLSLMAPPGLEGSLSAAPNLPTHFHRVGRDAAGRTWLVTRHPQAAAGGRESFVTGLGELVKGMREIFPGGLRVRGET